MQETDEEDAVFPVRREMYFPFYSSASTETPRTDWYQQQNQPSEIENQSNRRLDISDTNEESNRETSGEGRESDIDVQIAFQIVGEIMNLMSHLSASRGLREVSSHVTFDPEGRPQFSLDTQGEFGFPLQGGRQLGPGQPTQPPSYIHATADGQGLPAYTPNPNVHYGPLPEGTNSSNSQRTPLMYGTPPPSYSRATGHNNESMDIVQVQPRGHTPPPSYRRIAGITERPRLQLLPPGGDNRREHQMVLTPRVEDGECSASNWLLTN